MPKSDFVHSDIGSALAILDNAGYDKGDIVPIVSFNPIIQKLDETSTSYTYEAPNFAVLFNFADLPEGNIYVKFLAQLSNDTAGETTYAKIHDLVEGKDLAGTEITHTGTDIAYKSSGWNKHTPNTRDTVHALMLMAKVSGGTGDVDNPTLLIGVKL